MTADLGSAVGGGGATGPGGRRRIAALALALVVAATLPASAQLRSSDGQPHRADAAATGGDVAARRAALQTELDGIVRDMDLGRERQAEIRAEIDGLARDRARLQEQSVATASRLQAAEARLAVTEKRIGDLDRDVARAKAALEARRGTLADVLAALQRIGRKPPPAVMVRPEDALAAVRSAILVGALLPELRDEAEALLTDLQSLEGLKTAAAGERERFHGEAADLVAERQRLDLLIEERRKTEAEREGGLDEERRKAAALADRAGSLRDLVAALESAKPGAGAGAGAGGAVGPRLEPAVAFAAARGKLAQPVTGDTILRFGEDDGTGVTAKGLSIAARTGAAVTSPCDGTVIYAGSFRSYGKLLIINGGGGYHVILAGLDRIDVEPGQFVLAGEPVGLMGARGGGGPAAKADVSTDRPILYVEFRKDGTSIDPAPWWAGGRDEKVRG